jgi:type IV secretory pathway VirB2 component (pilin)
MFFSFYLFIFTGISPLQAQNGTWIDRAKEGGLEDIGTTAYGETGSPKPLQSIVGNVIKIALGLFGAIFVIIIILAGYRWMTAGGNEEKVKQSVAQIRNAVIGLLIVLAAYSITIFVTNSALEATNNF